MKPHTLEKGRGLPPRDRTDALLLFSVIGLASALALGGYLLDAEHEPTEAEVAQAAIRRQPYTSKAECWKGVGAYCGDCPCINYAGAVVAAQRFSPYALKAIVGTCGELQYTYTTDGHHSRKLFFDAAGELVAAHTTTDGRSMNIECPTWTHYGPLITCQPRVVRDYSAPLLPERLPPRTGRKTAWSPLVEETPIP